MLEVAVETTNTSDVEAAATELAATLQEEADSITAAANVSDDACEGGSDVEYDIEIESSIEVDVTTVDDLQSAAVHRRVVACCDTGVELRQLDARPRLQHVAHDRSPVPQAVRQQQRVVL